LISKIFICFGSRDFLTPIEWLHLPCPDLGLRFHDLIFSKTCYSVGTKSTARNVNVPERVFISQTPWQAGA